jgi:orotidine-5'-phosphate decarboxylase
MIRRGWIEEVRGLLEQGVSPDVPAMTSIGYRQIVDFIQGKKEREEAIETVKKAVKQLNGRGATFATVHGNDAILRAAAEAKGEIKILGVTVLTSLDRGDLDDLGFACDVEQLVLSRARRALANGCDGVISSGLEVPKLRAEVDDKLIAITPGIRPVENRPQDDQKRTVDVAQAFRNGADYIVVGRPIRQATDPYQMAQQIQRTIRDVFTPTV